MFALSWDANAEGSRVTGGTVLRCFRVASDHGPFGGGRDPGSRAWRYFPLGDRTGDREGKRVEEDRLEFWGCHAGALEIRFKSPLSTRVKPRARTAAPEPPYRMVRRRHPLPLSYRKYGAGHCGVITDTPAEFPYWVSPPMEITFKEFHIREVYVDFREEVIVSNIRS